MRLSKVIAAAGVLLTAACVPAPPPLPPAPVAVACPACPAPAAITAQAAQLRQALDLAVPQNAAAAAGGDAAWIAHARRALATAGLRLRRPQLLVVVDRNPAVQRLAIVLADPRGSWQVIGGSKVSTGQAGRRGYFITPTGVFVHDGEIRDYRALGTFNENHIRGLGLKGMRVWDFGWQTAEKGWEPDGATGEMRLLLHATDPDSLEPRLGRPASEGCVRIPAAMNRFLDLHGVLDREYEALARQDPAYAAVLAPDRQPTPLAGDKLVVIDSAAPTLAGPGGPRPPADRDRGVPPAPAGCTRCAVTAGAPVDAPLSPTGIPAPTRPAMDAAPRLP